MAQKSIDALASRFMTLAKKPELSKAERNELKQLMSLLKQTGMSNEEISALSGGKWSPRTIKCYTPGIKVSHPTQCDNVVQLLEKLKSSNLTLEDVESTVAIREELQSRGVSFEGVIDALFAVDTSNTEIADLIHQHDVFKKHGLAPEKVSEALSAMEELQAKGFGFDSLVMLLQAANTYGEAPEVLQAISTYRSLLELKEQVEAAKEGLEKVEAVRHDQENHIKEGEGKLAELFAWIDVYRKVTKLGYDEQVLTDLADMSQKFGGPKAVIQACKTYMDFKDYRG